MSKNLTTNQIKRIIELDGELGGIREQAQAFILSLSAKPKPRENSAEACIQALLTAGFHQALDMSEAAYRDSLPKTAPENDRPDLFDRLVLVDRRLKVVKTSELLGLGWYPDIDDVLVDYYDRKYPDVEFIWCQDGRRNRNKSVRTCRGAFVEGVEIGMAGIEGLCLYAQDRTVTDEPNDHALDLPGSVIAEHRDYAAYLRRHGGKVELRWSDGGVAVPKCGSASRRDC